jgi:hypothetical protein
MQAASKNRRRHSGFFARHSIWKGVRNATLALGVATPPAVAVDLMLWPIHKIFEDAVIPQARADLRCDQLEGIRATTRVPGDKPQTKNPAVLKCFQPPRPVQGPPHT